MAAGKEARTVYELINQLNGRRSSLMGKASSEKRRLRGELLQKENIAEE
jgi:hypothetical protein